LGRDLPPPQNKNKKILFKVGVRVVAQVRGLGKGLAPSPEKNYNSNYNNILFLSRPQAPPLVVIALFIELFILA